MATTWNNKQTLPPAGSTVVVKYGTGSVRPYGIVQVTNPITQIANDNNIAYWQYMSYFLSAQTTGTTNILSGYKEGDDNDWAPTVNGYIQLEYDVYMLRQQINARLQTLPTEVDGFDGIDYMNVIFGSTSVEQKAAALVQAIETVASVKSVSFINASWVDKEKGIFNFTFNVQSIFGDLQFRLGLDTQNKKVLTENT